MPVPHPPSSPCSSLTGIAVLSALHLGFVTTAHAHGISEQSRATMMAGGITDYIWLGAEHMLTGYDHLLFLFGVLFFLRGFPDVLRFITAFTVGHCITLLGATLAGITANAYLIDAVIALSVLYKGFENLKGFEKILAIRPPNLLVMVFIFGLIHGFGLSTRLQEITLGNDGMIGRILAFNVGVELGQVAALSVMIGLFAAWRNTKTFERFSTAANLGLAAAGIGLFVLQVDGYLHERAHSSGHHEHTEEHGDHDSHHDHHSQPNPTNEPEIQAQPPEEPKAIQPSEDIPPPDQSTEQVEPATEEAVPPKKHDHHHKPKKKHSHEHSHGDGKKHRH